jgi:dihydroorotate dehydrogenase electron transfer subunit
VKVIEFNDKQCAKAKPGQFLMIWIPGTDEIPLSVMEAKRNGTVAVVVKKVGEATRALHEMRVGEAIGVRGPFGTCFTPTGGNVLMVGGGTGMAPLLFLTRRLVSKAAKLTFVTGAKTKEELLFLEDLKRLCRNGHIVATTDDGSYGLRCMATDTLESVCAQDKFDMMYTCGPEQMMLKAFNLAERLKLNIEASLERLMRCAIGLCGSCVVGRYRVCRDGPVFASRRLREIRSEFGVSKLDFDGRRIPL